MAYRAKPRENFFAVRLADHEDEVTHRGPIATSASRDEVSMDDMHQRIAANAGQRHHANLLPTQAMHVTAGPWASGMNSTNVMFPCTTGIIVNFVGRGTPKSRLDGLGTHTVVIKNDNTVARSIV